MSQQMTRMVILQHREDLHANLHGFGPQAVSHRSTLLEDREEVVGSVLAVLERIPLHIAGELRRRHQS
jgi:hypothetical protein